jgi:hypothetical protein
LTLNYPTWLRLRYSLPTNKKRAQRLIGFVTTKGVKLVKNYVLSALAMAAAVAVSTPAQAVDLLNVVNMPAATNTPYSFAFTPATASTTISFAGYQVPSSFTATNIGLFLNNAGPNLLAQTWTFTAAPSGSLAAQNTALPVNNLVFAGVTVGSYDIFSQVIGTTAGSSYTLSFLFSNSANNQPSGFRVSASQSDIGGAVPEPGTWAMMIVGFGAVGFARRSRVRTAVTFA